MLVSSIDHVVARRDDITGASRPYAPGPSRPPHQPRGPSLRELTFSYRTKLDSNGRPVPLGPAVLRPDQVCAVLASVLEHEAVEVFGILCLTTRRRVICWHEVSRGGIAGTSIHPSDVFKAAITTNAAAIVLAHNHPSGDPKPSPDDLKATARLAEVGAMLGLEVLDHVIIGQDAYVSLHATGQGGFRQAKAAAHIASSELARTQ